MPWAKIGLGFTIAATLVACSLVDGLTGGSDDNCRADSEICEFCAARKLANACGNNDPGPCGDAWSCVRGPQPGCGMEFSEMLEHFRTTPMDCFAEGIPDVGAFRSCKPDSGNQSCFQGGD